MVIDEINTVPFLASKITPCKRLEGRLYADEDYNFHQRLL